jgi:putative restriction endonuclease
MLGCPKCHRTAIKERKAKLPQYRCSMRKSAFDVPESTMEDCTEFTAEFSGHFAAVHLPAHPSVLRSACPRYNGELAIQEVRLDRLPASLSAVRHTAERFAKLLLPRAAAGDEPFAPTKTDERARVERQIPRAPRPAHVQGDATGEVRFSVGLWVRAGGLTRAAHIAPFRGPKDNHPANGLLLRADLHTLFDVELLAIDPTTLRGRLHPRAIAARGPRWARAPVVLFCTLYCSTERAMGALFGSRRSRPRRGMRSAKFRDALNVAFHRRSLYASRP